MIYLIFFTTHKLGNAAVYCPKHFKCFQTVADTILWTICDGKIIKIGK